MWVVSNISSLNPATSKNFKPMIHLTNNKGEQHAVTLDLSPEEVRKLTVGQLEDIATGKITVKDALGL